MQLNPSTDFYDDDDDEDDDDDDDGFYDEDVGTVDDGEEPEVLPEAKSLVQEPAKRSYDADEEEEEDMGYDEDDERIAIAVERPRLSRPSNSGGFMNEEGSGRTPLTLTGYKHNLKDRLRLDHVDKYRHKQQKLLTESANSDDVDARVDAREGSGNFANDDEDDNDDDDDDDDDHHTDVDDGKDDDDDDDDDDNGRFFNGQRKKGAANRRRYFRKNTNDAIKIISTPLGKVGIVYQQSPNQDDDLQLKEDATAKKSGGTTFTDFDALSPDPASSHRLASSHPKITPVLTPDGKVALLYRGDSENSKYEPIRNLTHKFNTKPDNTPTLNSGSSSDEDDDNNSDADTDIDNDSKDLDTAFDTDKTNTDTKNGEHTEAKIIADTDFGLENGNADPLTPTKGSFIIRPTDSVLPMINRPLSEVLGIKKNQFKQFRIKDQPTTTMNPLLRTFVGVDAQQTGNGGQQQQQNSDTTTLHFLTKVNLADYPTSARTRNFDFDFSRDNTMLDERTRHPPPQDTTQETGPGAAASGGEMNTIANEEILSKTEVVNLAIVPHFDEDLERLQQLHDHESRRRLRQRHRQRQSEEDLSGTHCIMQAMMGIAAISTVFGMLGTFFKQRILDQLRLMHW